MQFFSDTGFEDMEILQVPEYRQIYKAVLKYEIQTLLQKLSDTGEESVVLTASIHDDSATQLGSIHGKDFLQSQANLQGQFLCFCKDKLKGHGSKFPREIVSYESAGQMGLSSRHPNVVKQKQDATSKSAINKTSEYSDMRTADPLPGRSVTPPRPQLTLDGPRSQPEKKDNSNNCRELTPAEPVDTGTTEKEVYSKDSSCAIPHENQSSMGEYSESIRNGGSTNRIVRTRVVNESCTHKNINPSDSSIHLTLDDSERLTDFVSFKPVSEYVDSDRQTISGTDSHIVDMRKVSTESIALKEQQTRKTGTQKELNGSESNLEGVSISGEQSLLCEKLGGSVGEKSKHLHLLQDFGERVENLISDSHQHGTFFYKHRTKTNSMSDVPSSPESGIQFQKMDDTKRTYEKTDSILDLCDKIDAEKLHSKESSSKDLANSKRRDNFDKTRHEVNLNQLKPLHENGNMIADMETTDSSSQISFDGNISNEAMLADLQKNLYAPINQSNLTQRARKRKSSEVSKFDKFMREMLPQPLNDGLRSVSEEKNATVSMYMMNLSYQNLNLPSYQNCPLDIQSLVSQGCKHPLPYNSDYRVSNEGLDLSTQKIVAERSLDHSFLVSSSTLGRQKSNSSGAIPMNSNFVSRAPFNEKNCSERSRALPHGDSDRNVSHMEKEQETVLQSQVILPDDNIEINMITERSYDTEVNQTILEQQADSIKVVKSSESGPVSREAHMCPICGKLLSTRGNCKQHLKTHLGLRPHKCNQCVKAFAASNDLKKHLRTHSGEKPYKCSICGRGFADGGNLKKHYSIHTRDRAIANLPSFSTLARLNMFPYRQGDIYPDYDHWSSVGQQNLFKDPIIGQSQEDSYRPIKSEPETIDD